MRYNTAAIRDLLNQALSDDELNTLAFDHFREIYDTYFSASLTRQQKTQILLEQVERRGETERLLEWVRQLNPAQMTAFAGQVLRLPPTAAPRRLPRRLIALVTGLIVLGIGAFLLVRSLRPQPGPRYQQATCQASATPVKVAMRPLSDCAAEVGAALLKDWTSVTAAPAAISATADAPLRSWSQADGYDLVVSGGCRGADALTLTFALSAIRNADDLYQPASVSVSGAPAAVTQVGAALIAFQHGDYEEAATQLASAATQVANRDLALLAASAVLFSQRHDEAIAALRELKLQYPSWSAVLNNLGVAYYNRSLSGTYATAGEDTLDEAIAAAQQEKARGVEFLALVNRANVHRHAGNNQKAEADCQAAERLDNASPWTRVCWLYYYLALIDTQEGKGQPLDRLIEEKLGVPQPGDPPRLQAMRGNWYTRQGQRDAAAAAYERFLEQMQFHACLQQDRAYLRDLQ